ncbi:Nif3-like dinuclear metal center hexameric protein [Halococcus hamelinensis]|uniref:Putative hydrolase-oxidase n=1 Tax=Halococcus hamelinensis 100A6 TaxID=1132509 RepID=M0LT81_9EURY|nr:Nif3-like dinuclear metal center hexameric protein [Halococcus hamelinensis]EMA36636.1 putative hydrolase-oxidase [Halococcus hamelinensis 100A6]
MHLDEFSARLDDRLRTDAFADLDASANGLQVDAPTDVDHAAFAVDAAVETADRAVEVGADVLVVHHGLFWGDFDRATGARYDRLAPFFEHDVGLYAAHLPLDGHPDLGNAAGVTDALELGEQEPFAALGAEHIGVAGIAPEGFTPDGLRAALADACGPKNGVQHLDFGPDTVERVAVATGSAADWFDEAVAWGADAFVTGEGKQQVYHEAKEAGIHVYLAGHYATETFGVRSVGTLAGEWGIETTFIDRPTGL